MSSRSGIIDTKESLLIVDPYAFPVNLGGSSREDSPESAFRLLAYKAKNVVPTALGYASYFPDNAVLELAGPLPSIRVQALFAWQTPSLGTLLIALCEEGIAISTATGGGENLDPGWQWRYNTGYSDPDLRHQWTYAVVANRLFAYCQGRPDVVVIADTASINNMESQAALIDGAAVDTRFAGPDWSLASMLPSFLNMEGQIGIFRANNRLGFWDSDNAVAWSSATQVMDFTPSIETFAGITTFADVQGPIVVIHGHGDGFIIYATRSITLAQGMVGSPERFKGSAIMPSSGVSFDIEVAASNPDTEHWAFTSSGLVRIRNGQQETIHVAVSDYLEQHGPVVGLQVLDGRYLFFYTADNFVPPKTEIGDHATVSDGLGNNYVMWPTEDVKISTGALQGPTYPQGDTLWYSRFAYVTPNTYDSGSLYNVFTVQPNGFLGTDPTRSTGPYAFQLSPRWDDALEGITGGLAEGQLKYTVRLYVRQLPGASIGLERIYWKENYSVDWSLVDRNMYVVSLLELGEPLHAEILVSAATLKSMGTITGFVDMHIATGASGLVFEVEYMIEDLNATGDGVVDLSHGLTAAINGTWLPVQEGLADFIPIGTPDPSPNPPTALPAPVTTELLMPCYSGYSFASDWDSPEGVDVIRGYSEVMLKPVGIGQLPWFVHARLARPLFDNGNTQTEMGPNYRFPGAGGIRVVDVAGEELAETIETGISSVAQTLINITGVSQKLRELNTDVLVPRSLDPELQEGLFGPAVSPYPYSIDLQEADLRTVFEREWKIRGLLDPVATSAQATECAVNFLGELVDWKMEGEATTYISVHNVLWTSARNVELIRPVDGSYNPVFARWIYYIKATELEMEQWLEDYRATTGDYDTSAVNGESWYRGIVPPTGTIPGAPDGMVPVGWLLEHYPSRLGIWHDPASVGEALKYSIPRLRNAWKEIPYEPIGGDDRAPRPPARDWWHDPMKIVEQAFGYGEVLQEQITEDNWGPAPAVPGYTASRSVDYFDPPTPYMEPIPLEVWEQDGPLVAPWAFWGVPSGNINAVNTAQAVDWMFPDFPGVWPDRFTAVGTVYYSYTKIGETGNFDVSNPFGAYVRGWVRTKGHCNETGCYNNLTAITAYPCGGYYPTLAEKEAFWAAMAAAKQVPYYDTFRKTVALNPEDCLVVLEENLVQRVSTESPAQAQPLVELEVSGYGTFRGGSNFRKTHLRKSSTSCPIPGPAMTQYWNPNDDQITIGEILEYPTYEDNTEGTTGGGTPWTPTPPVQYPDTWALYRQGSFAPIYPLYQAAAFWDMHLEKWGWFNNEHYVLMNALAINRADVTTLPRSPYGLKGGSLRPDGWVTNWGLGTPEGSITYGRIGRYRLGVTRLTGITARFATPAYGNLIVEASTDGSDTDPLRTLAQPLYNARQVEMTFTSTAQWFNIRVDGNFNLVGLSYESEARGRR